jgi:hypothetical protein
MDDTPDPLLSEDIPPPHVVATRAVLRVPPDLDIASGTLLFKNLEPDTRLDTLHDLAPESSAADLLATATELHFELPPDADQGPLPSRSGVVEVHGVRLLPDPDDATAQMFEFQAGKVRFAENLVNVPEVSSPGTLAAEPSGV